MIDILHSCIGTAKAQELMASAINTLESNERAACSSCGCEEELLVSQDGALLCRRCYSQRFWAEPPADAKKANLRECPKYPRFKGKVAKRVYCFGNRASFCKAVLETESAFRCFAKISFFEYSCSPGKSFGWLCTACRPT